MVDEELLEALERMPTKPLECEVFRQTIGSTPPDKANTRGARWNPPDVAALYTSLDRSTVLAEGEYLLATQPIRPKVKRTLHRLRVRLGKVLDLRSAGAREQIGLTDSQLRADDHWACRRIGEAANHLGVEAILVPSVRSQGDNLVILSTNARGAELEVIDSEDLGNGSR